jgi:hypothetical protein
MIRAPMGSKELWSELKKFRFETIQEEEAIFNYGDSLLNYPELR